ncbi:MAG: flagellar filament capping protein FliD [Bryobacteraceae bacterium]
MSITPLKFTGVSTFSADLQQILTRAVSIAQLPVKQIQSDQAVILTKKTALAGLSAKIDAVASALHGLGGIGTNRSISATSSNTTKVSVTLAGATTATSYSITEITSVARKASEATLTGFADTTTAPVDGDGQFELVVGSSTFAIDASGANTLEGVRDAINNSGAPVTATILNTGSGATPYYLSVTSNATGASTLQLRSTTGDSGSNILSSTNQGSDAVFKLNGLQVRKKDNLVTDVVPGLSFSILDTTSGTEAVTLNLTSSRGSLATALQNYVTAYNGLHDTLKSHIGDQGGVLQGDSIIYQAQAAVRNATGYIAPSGTVRSLTELGIDIDKEGVMSFDSTKFYSLPNATVESAYSFLGSRTTGVGALAARLEQLSDPISGAIRSQQNAYDQADKRLSKQVAEITVRIDTMQASMAQRLQEADALLSRLQGQQSQLDAILNGGKSSSSSSSSG